LKDFRASGKTLGFGVQRHHLYAFIKGTVAISEGFELSVATNHLGHFLLCNLMLEDLKELIVFRAEARHFGNGDAQSRRAWWEDSTASRLGRSEGLCRRI